MLEADSEGRLLVVCNTIPKKGDLFESEIVIRYLTDDMVLHTVRGNISAVVT